MMVGPRVESWESKNGNCENDLTGTMVEEESGRQLDFIKKLSKCHGSHHENDEASLDLKEYGHRKHKKCRRKW